MAGRLFLLAGVAGLELSAKSFLFPVGVAAPNRLADSLQRHFFSAAVIALGFVVALRLGEILNDGTPMRFGRAWLGAHALCVLAALLTERRLLAGTASAPLWFARCAAEAVAAGCLALALIPPSAWIRLAPSWSFRAGALALGCATELAARWLQLAWRSKLALPAILLQRGTLYAAHALLNRLIPGTTVDAAQHTISAPGFGIQIAGPCSGLEGIVLMLAFSAAWLWLRRGQVRMPRAMAMVPVALVSAYALNILRITALFWIGNSVSEEVAVMGFHTQAGWIAFTLLAIGFALALEHAKWVQKPAAAGSAPGGASLEAIQAGGESPLAIPFLVPFLAILASGMVSKAISGSFEWSYPLRFVAATCALWHYRGALRRLDWRCGWLAAFAGAAVFLLWIVPGFFGFFAPAGAAASGLRTLSAPARDAWIVFRIAAAVLTVPIAEELAFRGFLARRLMARHFDSIAFTRLRFLPIVISSAVFGAMHGRFWPMGIAAGMVYAWALRRSGRIGDAVAAHAVSNLLLAVWVLARGDYGLW